MDPYDNPKKEATTVLLTEQSEKVDELVKAFVIVQQSLSPVTKEAENEYFHSAYADLAMVHKHTAKLLADNGLAVIQTTFLNEGNIYLKTRLYHENGQFIGSVYPVKPKDPTPQGVGSALTYARRYQYMTIIGLSAEAEDDDGNAASAPPPKKVNKSVDKSSTTEDGKIVTLVSKSKENEGRKYEYDVVNKKFVKWVDDSK